MNITPTLPANTSEDAAPARSLQVQLSTRITTQPLHYRSGDEETAASSVHKLFDTTRELLVAHPKAAAFDVVAKFLLNDILRPYTARWHLWMVDERFADERTRRQFRYELKQLQPRLIEFGELLRLMLLDPAQTAAVQTLFCKIVDATPRPGRPAELGKPIQAGIGPEVKPVTGALGSKLGEFATVEQINQAESRFIHQRRQAFGTGTVPISGAEDNQSPDKEIVQGATEALPVPDATGLCLSGGGIRSATFCLGIVQVLARQGMLPQFDYLSTVSGGGYLGSFLTSYLGTPKSDLRQANETGFSREEMKEAINNAFLAENGRESAAVRHLRNNSRYLLNGGTWGRVKIFGLLVTGILTNILLVLPIPLAAALGVIGLKHAGYWKPVWAAKASFIAESFAGNLFIWLALVLGMAWLALPAVRNFARGKPPTSKRIGFQVIWETTALSLGLLTLAAGVLLMGPKVFHWIEGLRNDVGHLGTTVEKLVNFKALTLFATALAPVIFGLLAARLKAGKGKRWTSVLFALSGPLLYLVVFLWAGHGLVSGGWHWLLVAGLTGMLAVWGWLFVDINDFSPHGYYRARLCECYLAVRQHDQTGRLRSLVQNFLHGVRRRRVVEQTGVGTRVQLPLSMMNQTGAAPYHLVNSAVNLPSSHEPNLRGRDCDFFVFSRDYCGGPVCGYLNTEVLEKLDSHVDLGTAMAISGAAASSNMGVKTQRQYRFLITLLNVRLGYWLRNPLKGLRRSWHAPGPLYLFREMAGWMHEKMGYLNLSDGGHIENLALYELLRRRCKFIVIVDGGMEPGMECADLMLAQRYAQIDLGVQFDLDLADLALGPQRRSRAYAVFGKIRYNSRNSKGGDDIGWLVYLKLACTGGEPGYVVDYRRQNPDFPHQTTGEQIYDEAQFEAYRRLGECAAESLFRGELAGNIINPQSEPSGGAPRFDTLRDWFQALATNLLPDNDSAFERVAFDPTSAKVPQQQVAHGTNQ